MKTKKRKLRLKSWILQVIAFISILLIIYISQYQLIYIYKNSIDITNLLILILLLEATRKTTKELYKRIIQKMED